MIPAAPPDGETGHPNDPGHIEACSAVIEWYFNEHPDADPHALGWEELLVVVTEWLKLDYQVQVPEQWDPDFAPWAFDEALKRYYVVKLDPESTLA